MVFNSLKFFVFEPLSHPMPMCVYAKSHLQPHVSGWELETRGLSHLHLQKLALSLAAIVTIEAKKDLTFSYVDRSLPHVDIHYGSGHPELLNRKSSCLSRCFQVSALVNGARNLC